MDAHLPLLNEALFRAKAEFDGIFEGNNMEGTRAIDLFENGGNGCRFPGPGAPADQHKAALQLRYLLQRRVKIENPDVRRRFRHKPNGHAQSPCGIENVDADPYFIYEEGVIHGPSFVQGPELLFVQHPFHNAIDIFVTPDVRPIENDIPVFSINEGLPAGDVYVGDPLADT